MLHFTAWILQVDIQTKVLDFQEFTKIPGRGKQSQIGLIALEHWDRLLAQNVDARLAAIVI